MATAFLPDGGDDPPPPAARRPALIPFPPAALRASVDVWAFAFTYGMLWIIDRITPVRVGAELEVGGLDAGLHGEEAYPQGV